MNGGEHNIARSLSFADDLHALADAALAYAESGAGRFLLRPFGSDAAALADRLIASSPSVSVLAADMDAEIELRNGVLPADGRANADVTVLFCVDQNELSSCLTDRIESPAGSVLALKEARSVSNFPVFLVSIPKAGTHLALRLLEELGYQEGGSYIDHANPGHWYYLEFSNAHTVAPDFFIDSVRRQPFGNRAHPFPRSPVLFMYRHPFDILVSESGYYHTDGQTVFANYLSGLSDDERLRRLVDDPRLLGSLRERILQFSAWLEFDNVIPVSFEELVGSLGGGDDEIREILIWSILLKLQRPGTPADLAQRISDRRSPTFREGRIGNWVEKLSPEIRQILSVQPEDYLQQLGYSASPGDGAHPPPSRIDEFRNRPLEFSKVNPKDTPILIEVDFLGHNIVAFRGNYYGIPISTGPFDLTAAGDDVLGTFVSDSSIAKIKRRLIEGNARNLVETDAGMAKVLAARFDEYFENNFEERFAAAFDNTIEAGVLKQQDTPILIEVDFLGHNIVAFRGNYYGIPISTGPFDLTAAGDDVLGTFVSDSSIAKIKRRLIEGNARNLVETDAGMAKVLAARFDEYFENNFEERFAAAFDNTIEAGFLKQLEKLTTGDLIDKIFKEQKNDEFTWLRYRIARFSSNYVAVPEQLVEIGLAAFIAGISGFQPVISRYKWLLKVKILYAKFRSK